jgi:NADPH-dependent ferric siderophore reductase
VAFRKRFQRFFLLVILEFLLLSNQPYDHHIKIFLISQVCSYLGEMVVQMRKMKKKLQIQKQKIGRHLTVSVDKEKEKK